MISEAVGAVMTVGIVILTLTIIIPMLNTAKVSVFSQVNQSNPTNAQLVAIGDNVFYGIIVMVVIVGGLTVLAYATRRDVNNIGGSF